MTYEFNLKTTDNGVQINDEEEFFDSIEMAIEAIKNHCEEEGIEFKITL